MGATSVCRYETRPNSNEPPGARHITTADIAAVLGAKGLDEAFIEPGHLVDLGIDGEPVGRLAGMGGEDRVGHRRDG